ncbi:MAG: DUF2306 domain-containing protein [Rhizobiaceae bacterium]|nr:DUF2306 domain-containing protein [Rhizobiaceae bacterium]
MNFEPILNASIAIQLHMLSAVAALLVGALILWRRKGTQSHKFWGKVWVGLMLVVSISSIFIHEIRLWGDFSPIHLITVYVIVNLYIGISFARKGNIKAHRITMQGVYIGGLIIAGAFTFLPGRITFEMFFGEGVSIGPTLGWVIGLLGAVGVGISLYWRGQGREKIL